MLGRMVRLQIAASAIRDMEHTGGFDKFLLNQEDTVLSKRALAVKNSLKRKLRSKN
jgi:large subunit ribosomal protein L28